MKIRKLHLKNYKVFDDLELDFTDENGETLNEIVIAGVNGSGKTTVLEFIRDTLAKKPNDNEENYALFSFPDADTAYAFSYLMDDDTIDNLNGYHFSYFHNKRTPNLVEVRIMKGVGIPENVSVTRPVPNSDYKLPPTLDRAIFRPANNNNEVIDKALLFTVSLNAHKEEMERYIIKHIRNQVFNNGDIPSGHIVEQEINLLNKIFEGIKINSRLVHLNDDQLIFESSNGNRISFDDLSSGEKRLYFLGFILKNLNINNSMIIIDEPEDSLHPTWQQQILKFYSNIGENNQVILATHSPHIIGSAKPESVFLLKPENGKINAYHPQYAKGHSVNYVLSEIMETNPRENRIGKMVDEYLRLIEKGMHETEGGKELWEELKKIDPNSNERGRIRLALRRLEAIGK